MKPKSRILVLKRNKMFKYGVVVLSFAILIKIVSAIGGADALCNFFKELAGKPEFAEDVLKSEIPSDNDYSASDFVTDTVLSQSAILNTKQESAPLPEIEFAPWSLSSLLSQNDTKTLPIKPLSINPTSPDGYVNLGKIYLKNDSSKTIDLNSYLKADMPFSLKGDGPHVLIVHTHGSEAYFPAGRDSYTPDDVERTQDTRYNVVRIGDEIENILKENGISVVHDRNIYDSPSYTGSYTRTLEAITAQMKKTPGIKVILDIHRDAITAKNGTKYKTSATVNGEPSAQLMLVMSTGESGLPHPNWQENLKFGIKLQCQIANKYPGLMRPINLRTERFNMHVTTGSLLVEVGSSANTLQEALTAIRPFSQELAALLNSVKK